MMLVSYLGLQLLDGLTTLRFLSQGVGEANPLIRLLVSGMPHPWMALAVAKCGAAALGVLAWRSGRLRLLRRVNLLFGAAVVWNVAAIVLAR